jgi:hypothetical protein
MENNLQSKLEMLQKIVMVAEGLTAKQAKEKIEKDFEQYAIKQLITKSN